MATYPAETSTTTDPQPSSSSGGFLHPERIVSRLDIRPGMVVADLGCGAGHFAIAAARIVGETGQVFAIDIQKQAIEAIQSRANLEHLLQVKPVWADLELPEGSRLPQDSVDLAIISNILFQADKKQEVMIEAHRILSPAGHLVVLEWDQTPFPAGPAMDLRVPKRVAITLAERAGLAMEKEFDAGSNHYGLLFKKQ